MVSCDNVVVESDGQFDVICNPSDEIFDQIAEWACKTESWAFQKTDYALWKKGYDDLWLYAIVDRETQKFVACVSLAKLAPAGQEPLFSVAVYYCKPDQRGKGFGKKLFDRMISNVGDNNATLWGVLKMSPKYASVFGFNKILDCTHMFTFIETEHVVLAQDLPSGLSTQAWKDVDLNEIHAYDRTICPLDRSHLMQVWFEAANTHTKVVFSEGKIVGYATFREVVDNRILIAPMYADSHDAAIVLFHDTLASIPKWASFKQLIVVHPDVNDDVIKLVTLFSGGQFLSVPAMRGQFTKKIIETPQKRVYSITDSGHGLV